MYRHACYFARPQPLYPLLCAQNPRRESIAFSVGFSPVKASGLRRLTRQKASTNFKLPPQPRSNEAMMPAPERSTPVTGKAKTLSGSRSSGRVESKVRRLVDKFETLTPVQVLFPSKNRSRSPLRVLQRRLSLAGSSPNKIQPMLTHLSRGFDC